MSGSIQGAPTASMTISGGQSGVVPVSFGYYPPEGSRCVTAQYNWTTQTGFVEDLSQLAARGVETSIQSAYVDNSSNPQAVTILVLGSEQVISCPPNGQGIFPLFFTGTPMFQISVPAASAGAVTRLYLLNVPGGGGVWAPAGSAEAQALVAANGSNPAYTAGTVQPLNMTPNGGLITSIAAVALGPVSQSGTIPGGWLINLGLRYNSVPSAVSNSNQALCNAWGSLLVDSETTVPAYSCGLNSATVAGGTDWIQIAGSATKTVRIHSILMSGIITGGIQIVKRSTLGTGQTVTGGNQAVVPHDSNNAAATATVQVFSVSPTAQGTAIGNVIQINANGTDNEFLYEWGKTDQSVVLRGVNENLTFSCGAASSQTVAVTIKWTEV